MIKNGGDKAARQHPVDVLNSHMQKLTQQVGSVSTTLGMLRTPITVDQQLDIINPLLNQAMTTLAAATLAITEMNSLVEHIGESLDAVADLSDTVDRLVEHTKLPPLPESEPEEEPANDDDISGPYGDPADEAEYQARVAEKPRRDTQG